MTNRPPKPKQGADVSSGFCPEAHLHFDEVSDSEIETLKRRVAEENDLPNANWEILDGPELHL